MEQKTKINVWYFMAAGLAIMVLQNMWSQSKQVEVVPYSEVRRYLEADQAQEFVVNETHVYGVFKLPLADGKRQFSALRVGPDLANDLSKYDIKVSGGTEQTLFKQLLGWEFPAAKFVGIWLLVVRRFAEKQGMRGGLMSMVRASCGGLRHPVLEDVATRCATVESWNNPPSGRTGNVSTLTARVLN